MNDALYAERPQAQIHPAGAGDRSLLTHERAMELLALAQRGDKAAQSELVEKNTALVKSVVKRFLGRGAEYDDLYQLGAMGLVKAIANFSPTYGVRFSTYAVPMITGEIRRFLRDHGAVKVSRPLKELAYKASRLSQRLLSETGTEPPIDELARQLGTTPEELACAREAAMACISLSEPVFEDEKSALIDRLTFSGGDEGLLDRLLLRQLIKELGERDRKLILLRYFRDKTQSETAEYLGVSQVQVSRLESRIISRLRESMGK